MSPILTTRPATVRCSVPCSFNRGDDKTHLSLSWWYPGTPDAGAFGSIARQNRSELCPILESRGDKPCATVRYSVQCLHEKSTRRSHVVRWVGSNRNGGTAPHPTLLRTSETALDIGAKYIDPAIILKDQCHAGAANRVLRQHIPNRRIASRSSRNVFERLGGSPIKDCLKRMAEPV